ncbi:hypothetical protein LY76DRAFT_86123 [Colletotrichum caudatum]|nr:hypothetical protein LY76DRAFT_86123 [Colletotrichum caudatum]
MRHDPATQLCVLAAPPSHPPPPPPPPHSSLPDSLTLTPRVCVASHHWCIESGNSILSLYFPCDKHPSVEDQTSAAAPRWVSETTRP